MNVGEIPLWLPWVAQEAAGVNVLEGPVPCSRPQARIQVEPI